MASRRGARIVGGVLWGLAAAHVVEALTLRRRREAVEALPPAKDPAGAGQVDVLSIAGTEVDAATRVAVSEAMERGAGVVNLIPGDLPPDRWLRLLRWLDPGQVGANPLFHPGGVNEAVALHPSVSRRMGVGGDTTHDRGTLAREIKRAQRHAPTSHTVVLAPGVSAGPQDGLDLWREREGVTAFGWPYINWAPIATGLETAHLLAMTAGALVSPVPALAALATWALQPMLVLAPTGDEDTSPTPAELLRASVERLPRALATNAATVAAGNRITRARAAERAATPPPAPLAHDEQFEPRRDTCFWCGSPSIIGHHDMPDVLQHKPGLYHLDECRDCGHIFQNPRLAPAGLDMIYADAYSGAGREFAELCFMYLRDCYRSREETLERFTTPKAILDVGTAHAYFALSVHERWPDTRIDALDIGDAVQEAERRGWVDTAYSGDFVELAGTLPRSYDVVVMSHFLEHVPDPRAHVLAATKVLDPGGLLLIEVPDGTYPLARKLGRFWHQWGQPEHLHFMPSPNLVAAVEAAGFDVLSVERVVIRGDFLNSFALFLQYVARSPHLPWLPDPGLAHRIKRFAIYTAGVPVLGLAKLADLVKDRQYLRDGRLDPDTPSNSYRILARLPD